MKLLILLAFGSVVVARPAEEGEAKKNGEGGSAVIEIENLKHKRPFLQNPYKYKYCPGGYQVYGPFGPGVILNQGQGSNPNSGPGVNQIIGINNGYIVGPNRFPNCNDSTGNNCGNGIPSIPPNIILQPGQLYGNGDNSTDDSQQNKPNNENNSEYDGGNSGNEDTSSNSGNKKNETDSYGTGQGGGSKPPTTGQGTVVQCKRCPQATKSSSLDLTATNNTEVLEDKIFPTVVKDVQEVEKSVEKTEELVSDVDTQKSEISDENTPLET